MKSRLESVAGDPGPAIRSRSPVTDDVDVERAVDETGSPDGELAGTYVNAPGLPLNAFSC